MDLHYNAFISYRHHPQDIKVAETIHRSLERFKVPKTLKKQGKSIERIFRDKEELPITSSLTDTITMALRNSDYQIVICSTHLKGSYWVQREIETFLQTHTKDKVLTVLVDGDNPYDVIPEILTYNEVIDPVTGEVTREPIEPLSCDWRLPKRKAMKAELPRLAAVLLGCTYDDLIQRQKQYRQRRLMAGVSTGMAASLALAGYFLYTSIQIQENLDQSLRNQSQYLASTSQALFDEGDRLTALALAMEALPNNGDRPYVPAAEQALTEALMLYEPTGQLISEAAFNAESSIENFVVSDDGETIYILDNQYYVTAWDTYDHKKLSTFNILGIQTLNSKMITDNNSNLITMGGQGGKTILCYTRDGELLWQTENIEDIAFYHGKETLLAIRKIETNDVNVLYRYELLQIDPKTGELTTDPFEMFDYNTLHGPFFTADTYYEGHPVSIGGYVNNIDRILIVDPATQKTRIVLEYDALFYGSSVSEDGNLYVLVTENEDISNGRLGNYYFHTQAGAYAYCFDMNKGSQKWCTYVTSYNYSEANTIAPIQGTDRLFCQYGSAFLQLDAKTGKILEECHSTSIPLTIQMRDTTAWVLFTNGCAGSYTFATNTIGYIQYMENGLLLGHNNQGIYVVPQLSSSVLLYRTTADENFEEFSGEYDDYIDDLRIHDHLLVTYGMSYLNLFDLNTRELLWKQDVGYSHYLLGFSSDGSKIYTRKYFSVYQFDVLSGEMTEFSLPLGNSSNGFTMYSNCINYANDTICCMTYQYGLSKPYIFFFQCDTQEFEMMPFLEGEALAEWQAIGEPPTITHLTDTYVLIKTGSSLYRFDRTTNEVSVVPGTFSSDFVFLEDIERDRMVFRTDTGIVITDIAGELTQNIPIEDFFAVSFFFYEDNLLCLGSDGSIHRYDLDGNALGTIGLSLFSNYFAQTNNISYQNVPVSWAVTPDNEIVVNVFRMGNIINTENWERTCDIQQLVFYHEGSDSYIVQTNDMIYAYQRCTLDEIISRAKDALGSFALTDEQREYYGLNETT